ncbi:MAG: dTMP kinase [Candidatus Methylopumilus sp.]|nr:dTMP kinase [Candidatus Methylopumilus sp.]
MRGKFITLEGMDGAGKSTHIPDIIKLLKSKGVEVVATREPGGTMLGEQLRKLLLNEPMHPETETLLMFAARKEHIAKVIEPALTRGAWVLSDRFTDATYAYQSGGRGVLANKVIELESWVHGSLQPDLTLLFDVPVEVSVARLASARTPDKFERESSEFFTKIRNAYLDRANKNPNRFCIINSNQALDDVKVEVENIISTL